MRKKTERQGITESIRYSPRLVGERRQIKFQCTVEEYEKILGRALKKRRTLSAYCAEKLLDEIAREEAEEAAELAKKLKK